MRCLVYLACIVASSCQFGCSAFHWGGEDSGRTPGLHVYGPSLFSRAELAVTGNTNAAVDNFTLVKVGDNVTVELGKLVYGQDVSGVVEKQSAKIEAIADMQMTQVQYIKELTAGIAKIVEQLTPLIGQLGSVMGILKALTPTKTTGVTATIPGIGTIGANKASTMPDVSALLKSLADVKAITATQPSQ